MTATDGSNGTEREDRAAQPRVAAAMAERRIDLAGPVAADIAVGIGGALPGIGGDLVGEAGDELAVADAGHRARPARLLPPVVAEPPSLAGLAFSIVPHTHWDREWYLPFEVFRLRLVRTVDEILDVLDRDPRCRYFTLDGQAAILDDYLELRPEREAQLRRLIADGRLAAGPAYVLPDEFLIDAETHVRNLLAGRRRVQELGGAPMGVGYQPDPFGHIAQMPQLLRGFGLDAFVFWRGLGDEVDRIGPVFRWQGPDGSWVYGIRQLDGYGGGCELGRWTESGVSVHGHPERWPDEAAHRFRRFIRRHAATVARSPLRHLSLANGCDHAGIQADLPDMLEAAAANHPETSFAIDRYDRYVETVRTAGPGALETVAGELVGAREAHILRGVDSARMYLKQRHERAERSLLAAETLASLAGMTRRAPYPRAALAHAWRELLRNSPHDSITGCSVDPVHRGMLDRYDRVDQITGRLRREALAALVGRDEPWTIEPTITAARSVLNLLPHVRRRAVAIPLPAELASETALVADRPEGSLPAQVAEVDGRRCAIVVPTMAGFGAVSLSLRRGTTRAEGGGARLVDERAIENERYEVRVEADGALAVLDRTTRRLWRDLAWLEDEADRGDEYDFRGLDDPRPWTSRGGLADVRVVATGPLVAELEVRLVARLPLRLDPDLRHRSAEIVDVPISTRVRLTTGVERVELRTTLDNRVEDHRLRVRFGAPDLRGPVRAEGQWAVLRRPARPEADGTGWQQDPPTTHHTSGAVAIGDLAILGRGLPEYEAVARPDGGLDIARTLLRCVGALGRDLPSRSSGAGPEIPTPDAQCPGVHVLDYAIAILPDATDGELVRASLDYRTELELGPAGSHPPVPLTLGGDPIAFSALKAAEDGAGWILRLWNPDDRPATVEIVGPRATRCRMDESALVGGEAGQAIGPWEVATYRLG